MDKVDETLQWENIASVPHFYYQRVLYMNKFVIYESDNEILITTVETEEGFRELYKDRDFDNKFDRKECHAPALQVTRQGKHKVRVI